MKYKLTETSNSRTLTRDEIKSRHATNELLCGDKIIELIKHSQAEKERLTAQSTEGDTWSFHSQCSQNEHGKIEDKFAKEVLSTVSYSLGEAAKLESEGKATASAKVHEDLIDFLFSKAHKPWNPMAEELMQKMDKSDDRKAKKAMKEGK